MASSEQDVSAGRALARPLTQVPVRIDTELVVEVLELLVGADGEAGVGAAGLPPLLRLAGVRAVATVVRRGSHVVLVGSAGYDCGSMAPGAVLPLDSGMPVTEAVRTQRPVVLGSGPAWVAVPFPPRTRQGALLLSLHGAPPETEAEMWRLHRIARAFGEGLRRAAEQEQDASDLTIMAAQFAPALSVAPGWEVAVRTLPGEGSFAGDTVVCLHDDRGGQWFMVADVCGSGAAAALVARSAQATLTTLVPYADGPAALLRAADRSLRAVVGPESFVTALAVRVHDARIDVASAGHPPPVVLTSGGAHVVPVEPGPPLALETESDPTFTLLSAVLPLDAALLIHTDGLLDRRGADGPSAAEIGVLVAGLPLGDLDVLADGVLAAASAAGAAGDDVSLLVARQPPAALARLAGRGEPPARRSRLRTMASRRPLLALLASVVLVALPTGARASCASPSAGASVAGTLVTVSGQAWLIGCQDVCECTSGCSGQSCDCGPPPRPVSKVTIEVLDPRGTVIGTSSARPDLEGRIEMPVAVPADATPASVRVVGEGVEVLAPIVTPPR